MKILGLADVEVPAVYNPHIKKRFRDIELVISCGDLPPAYLEFVVSMLDRPLYYVHGNHVQKIRDDEGNIHTEPPGAINLHENIFYDEKNDLILAGIEGSLIYNFGPYQYSQKRMWKMVYGLVPKLMMNKITYGRYLDIFVTHAPSAGIHDEDDPAHQGVDAFRWLIETFKPRLHLHGHVHVYNPFTTRETQHNDTRVINTYGYREITL